MKSLKTIQKLSKIGKILSKIVFISSIIGFIFCLITLLSVSSFASSTTVIEGKTLVQMFEETSIYNYHTSIDIMTTTLIFIVAEAITAKFAENYFRRELEDGTPFTLAGAKEMLKLGIICLSLTFGAYFIGAIADEIFSSVWADIQSFDFNSLSMTPVGIGFIVMSVICKYGAELRMDNVLLSDKANSMNENQNLATQENANAAETKIENLTQQLEIKNEQSSETTNEKKTETTTDLKSILSKADEKVDLDDSENK